MQFRIKSESSCDCKTWRLAHYYGIRKFEIVWSRGQNNSLLEKAINERNVKLMDRWDIIATSEYENVGTELVWIKSRIYSFAERTWCKGEQNDLKNPFQRINLTLYGVSIKMRLPRLIN